MKTGRGKCLGVILKPEVFRSLAYYSRCYEMTPRAFLGHMVGEYVKAMERAEPSAKGTDRGR